MTQKTFKSCEPFHVQQGKKLTNKLQRSKRKEETQLKMPFKKTLSKIIFQKIE